MGVQRPEAAAFVSIFVFARLSVFAFVFVFARPLSSFSMIRWRARVVGAEVNASRRGNYIRRIISFLTIPPSPQISPFHSESGGTVWEIYDHSPEVLFHLGRKYGTAFFPLQISHFLQPLSEVVFRSGIFCPV